MSVTEIYDDLRGFCGFLRVTGLRVVPFDTVIDKERENLLYF